MRNAIKEYLCLTETEKKELWENAVFVFDTNIFLNLYRYTEDTRESLLNAMKELSDRIWMPKHVAQELMKDRPKVIFDTLKNIDVLKKEKDKFIENCRKQLRRENKDTKLENMSKEIDKHIELLMKESNYISSVDEDDVLNQLLSLFEKKVGIGFSDKELQDIKKEGAERYEKQIPPGYKDLKKGEDNNTYGDLIIWKEILLYAQKNNKDIIYVTDDQKDDWWDKVGEHTLGPRVELRKEFWEETKKKFHMYNMNRFLVYFKEIHGTKIQQSAIDEVENYQRMIEENRIRVMRERARRFQAEKISAKKNHLLLMLDELNKEQNKTDERLRDIELMLKRKSEFKSDDVSADEKYNVLLEEYSREKIYLQDILQRKINAEKEMDMLTWKEKKYIDLIEKDVDVDVDQ
jgi:hypothetical protein